MKIREIIINNYKCFKDVRIDCSSDKSGIYQWTVLLGENNTGKTSILKSIANLCPVQYVKPTEPDKSSMINAPSNEKLYVPTIYYDKTNLSKSGKEFSVEIKFNTPLGHPWRYRFDSVSLGRNPNLEKFKLYAYGVSRYPSETKLSDNSTSECSSLFEYGRNLTNFEEWLMQLDYASKNEKVSANNKLYKIKELLCGTLFPEILDFRFGTISNDSGLINYVEFQTKDGWFRYTELGYGYQSMLSWIVDLCKKMFDRYPESQNPLTENAIVLIDEIDLHLHPQWQRGIISLLSEFFPNIQFIATTHSPLVIQSMDNVNLYVLKRKDDEVIAERSNVTNFQGWSVEEILNHTMNLSSVYTDVYQALLLKIDTALDNNDIALANESYGELKKILHPNNPLRRLLKIQIDSIND